MLLFILGYMVMLIIGEKKQERYFLPAYPWFDLIAAAGLLAIFYFIFSRITPPQARKRHASPSTPYLSAS